MDQNFDQVPTEFTPFAGFLSSEDLDKALKRGEELVKADLEEYRRELTAELLATRAIKEQER
jgi:hypothetical protein